MRAPLLTVVVCTYEWPEALDAVLAGLGEQSERRFEVVATEDGASEGTAAVVAARRSSFGDRLAHVAQPDKGSRAALAPNRGALAARSPYLVFLDGDCVPRRHFVRALARAARRGWFVAGRRIRLSRGLTERALASRLPLHRRRLGGWLLDRARGEIDGVASLTPRDRRRVGRTRTGPEFEPHDRAFGVVLGVSRDDLERVNGFDARFVGWGEEDVDVALRLRRLGLRCGHAGPAATVLHLWHPPRWTGDRPTLGLLAETERGARVEAVAGLRELRSELAPAAAR